MSSLVEEHGAEIIEAWHEHFGVPLVLLHVDVSDDTPSVTLSDGRALNVPSSWHSRLAHATATERASWTIIDGGTGVHWGVLDEDVSLARLLTGTLSPESQESLEGWLAQRADARSA